MPSLFFGIHTAKQGLLTQQKAMDVTGHNVANVNTPGYTRQGVVMQTTVPYSGIGAGHFGSGVLVTQVQRFRDDLVDKQIKNETGNLGYLTAQSDTLQNIEVAFAEPSDYGLSTLYNDFWNGWQDFSTNPESLSVKRNLIEKAVTLSQGLNNTYANLETINQGIDDRMAQVFSDSETLVQSLEDLEKQIILAEANGKNPNDLYDRKVALMEDLSKLRDFTLQQDEFGITITFQDVDANGEPKLGHTKGELAGLVEAKDFLENTVMADINKMAGSLKDKINAVSVDVTDYATDPPTVTAVSLAEEFFTFNADPSVIDPSTAVAKYIQVNPNLVTQPSNLTIGDGAATDGNYALKVSQLRHDRSTMTDATFEDFWQNIVVGVGSATRETMRKEENQEALLGHLQNRREEISGVSIDEELVNMIKFQRAFEASSRMVTVLDEMLDTLINRTGR